MSTSIALSPRVIGGRFEIERLLGEGASARTYLCRDRETQAQVALKELHVAHAEDWKRIELFEREAQVLAGLRHHAVPQIFDSIEEKNEDGAAVLILVQEFIEGDSLATRMQGGPTLGQVEIIQLTLGILDVLEYLHGRSPPVYHRDIKPSNIIVRPTGAPVLVDFGSVTTGWRSAADAGSTVTGTFGYMPPEQLMGQVGPTSDLYALGATLLHVITGRPPTDFPFDSGRIEVPEDLPAPSGLRRLVNALLEPAPNTRPQSVKEARGILLGEESEPSSAMVRVGRNLPAIIGGEGPQFVDLGPPPRDPEGEHSEVYKLLMEPMWTAARSKSPGVRALQKLGLGLLSVVSFGIVPIVFLVDKRVRQNKYEEVFRNGIGTQGRIVEIKGNEQLEGTLTLLFEFTVGEVLHRNHIAYPGSATRLLTVGDTISVLYLEDEPARACVVFKP